MGTIAGTNDAMLVVDLSEPEFDVEESADGEGQAAIGEVEKQ